MDSTKRSGKTKLHWAVIKNVPPHPSQSYDDINAKDQLGRSALHWAAALNNAVWAQYLMETLKAKFLQDNDGRTPLHEAAIKDNGDIVELFLNNNDFVDKINAGDNFQRTALQWAVATYSDMVQQQLIDAGASIFATDASTTTALERAVRGSHEGLTDRMCKELKDGPNDKTRDALKWAVENGEFKVGTQLVRCTMWKTTENQHGYSEHTSYPWGTLLQYAVEREDKEIEELLLSKDMLNAGDYPHRTPPLAYAAMKGLDAVVQLLLSQKDIRVDVSDQHKRTPLIHAAMEGHKVILGRLIDKGADINAGVGGNGTPLSHAARNGHKEIVAYLTDKGADINTDEPLFYAAKIGHEDIVRLLLRRNALVKLHHVQEAESRGHHGIAELLREQFKPEEPLRRSDFERAMEDLDKPQENPLPLSDYEQVLETLERQNKKRLLMAKYNAHEQGWI
ncbi:hypothetical protein PG987_010132 [Apiospora arundinis]